MGLGWIICAIAHGAGLSMRLLMGLGWIIYVQKSCAEMPVFADIRYPAREFLCMDNFWF